MSPGYLKDKNAVYYLLKVIARVDHLEIIADPQTFQFLSENYFKYAQTFFFARIPVDGPDAASFEIVPRKAQGVPQELIGTSMDLPRNLAKDKNYLYRGGNRNTEQIDTATFEFVNAYYAKDKHAAYYTIFAKNEKGSYFYNYRKLPEADVATFTLVSLEDHHKLYAKDENNLYFDGEIVAKEDGMEIK